MPYVRPRLLLSATGHYGARTRSTFALRLAIMLADVASARLSSAFSLMILIFFCFLRFSAQEMICRCLPLLLSSFSAASDAAY